MSKEFIIENEYLKVTVTTWGAQVKSVIRKSDNTEHIWQADKSVWGYHAPILFPHAGKVVDVRHILVAPQGGTKAEDGSTTYSDDEWAAAEKKAQDLLNRYLEGDKTEEFFGELAELYTEDPGSKETGGLYENVKTGDMVPEFDAWCFDENRKVGDTGMVKTTYGYHVMFYSGDEALWIYKCREAVREEKIGEFVKAAVEAQELKVDYEKVLLGDVKLAG